MLRYALGVTLLAAIVEHRHAGFDRYVDTADAGEIPLYRMWNSFGDSNHRFTPERAVAEEMTAKGWVDEGTAMCVRAS
jgi:hypothetical protein